MNMLIGICIALLAQPDTLLANPAFADGAEGWTATGESVGVILDIDPRGYAHAAVPEGVDPGYPRWEQTFPATPGAVYFAGANALPQAVRDGYGAYISVSWHDAENKRISFDQSSPAHRDLAWAPLTVRTVAPPAAVTGRLSLILNGHGDAYFNNTTLTLQRAAADKPAGGGPVTMAVTGITACDNFLGFGAEDDGWFYNDRNREMGVEKADEGVREARITHMDPDWVRMFFWYPDWNPSGDRETFTFDSPNMQSHYRSLDLYQRLGAAVNVTGVEWTVDAPFAHPPQLAKAIGALLEHLVRERGYTCIKYWTLTNEPNLGFLKTGATFADFVRIHTLVKAELEARDLDIQIVGADNTSSGLNWFLDCVRDPEYNAAADVYASHVYLKRDAQTLATDFFVDHLSALQESKPWIVAEFGFQDHESSHRLNPLMQSWDYALWTAAFVIEGLNRGVAGFSIWCLHEVYYPGNGPIMNYGLWRFKEDGWAPKPVYHVWTNFSRLTETGDAVRLVNTTDAARVNGAYVGDTFFWLNQSSSEAEIEVQETNATEAVIYTAADAPAPGDSVPLDTLPMSDPAREMPGVRCTHAAIEIERFTAPPRSFGYLR